MLYFLVGLIILIMKSNRFIYILLSLEIIIIGILMFNMSLVSELNFIIILVFSVVSRVMGLLMMVILLSSYGHEYIKF
jgi:hypothetical protein